MHRGAALSNRAACGSQLALEERLDRFYNPPMRLLVWRFLLACLMLVAIPLQGFAAASMLGCGAGHESLYGSSAQGVVNKNHEQHLHRANPADHHDSAASSAEHSATGVPSHATGEKFKCNACGPCCIGAALTAELVLNLAPFASSADFPDLTSHHLSPALGGLDRPPQHIFA